MSGIDNTPAWADILTALTDRDAVLTALHMFGAAREDAIIAGFRNVIAERDTAREEVKALRARVAELEAEPRRDDSTDFTRLMDHIRQRMQSQAASAGAFTSRGDHANALRSLHQSDALWFVIHEWNKGSSVRRLGASDTPAAVAVKAAEEAAND